MEISDNKEKQAAMDVAEDSRETEWHHPSFVAELFKGNFRWDLISPYPFQDPADKKIGDDVLKQVESIIRTHIDPDQVDETETLPETAIKAMADAGFFGLKIDKKYGGMGLSVYNYARIMEFIGSYCGSTAVWLSAHQSIGVPQPLKMFGTEEQKQMYLPRLAKGAISAFALTEPDVGSDPAKMSTTATLSDDGQHYIINGEKLYITNGPAAEIMVVMAVTPPKIVNGKEKKQISAFILETNSPGFEVVQELSFMGIRGIRNGHLKFNNVKIPAKNIIGEPGKGLKIALATLNTGRLTIPAVSSGAGKLCLLHSTQWSKKRVQWGHPVGEHQEVAKKLAVMAGHTFAMDAVSYLTASNADNKNADIRLEAAMAKYFGSEAACMVADECLQIRGGRGFERAESLKKRGEDPVPVERMVRDLRINRIIEGTSEIMRLFIAREAMDIHIKTIMVLLDRHAGFGKKLSTLFSAAKFYVWWYPKLWLPLPKFFGTKHLNAKNRSHLRYINRTARQMARALFHTMMKYQIKLEKEQLILAKYVDIGTELFAMAGSLARAEGLMATQQADQSVQDVVDNFCRGARRRIRQASCAIYCNDNKHTVKLSKLVMDGKVDWMLSGIVKPE